MIWSEYIVWDEKQIVEFIEKNLNKQRFEHSLRVADTAKELAKRYSADIEKAKLAGLVHDCAKNMSDEEMINIISENNCDEIYIKTEALMHGLAGGIIAKNVMKITDEEVLNAVIYHTTGRENMSTLEKIIYIADYIEPMRNFEGVEKLRDLAYKDLDEALLLSLSQTINYVIQRNQPLHLDTVKARNFLIMKKCR